PRGLDADFSAVPRSSDGTAAPSSSSAQLTIHYTMCNVLGVPTKPRLPLLFRTFRSARQHGGLTVGDVAHRLQQLGYQASPSLIRKLEREGLVRIPDRTEGNYRVLDEAVFERIRRILGLRALGLSVDTIRTVLGALDHPRQGHRKQREDLLSHLDDLVGKRIRQLEDLRAVLRKGA